ncbi:MAG: adenine phosphoribosyltransferase [Euryarchaeota archaeon RBG_19FT_COMBO_56_21]|nr:MAG: adenine phosphoribosyltransferase [Euryarchaeota archaeon RBG_19FT_COMBO_56_21]
MDFKSKIKRIPEFKGVVFWDITPLLKDRHSFRECVREMADSFRGKDIDIVVSNEARGFIVGAAVAHELGVGFVPIRKKGKLPPKVHSLSYDKEYESDTIEIREDAIGRGDKVLLVDDLLATGGTIKANADLVERLGGKVVGMGFLVELEYLHPRKNLGSKYDIHSLIVYKSTDDA